MSASAVSCADAPQLALLLHHYCCTVAATGTSLWGHTQLCRHLTPMRVLHDRRCLQVLDALPLGLQMRIMRAAPSLKDLLCVLPPHMHVAALSAKIRTIDATSSLQIPHNWCATAAWLPGVATVASLTHLTRLSAATANKGRPTCDALPEAHTDRLLDTLGHLSRLRNLTLCGLRLQNGQTAQLATCMRLLPGLSSLRLSGTIPGGGLLQNVLQPCTALVSLSLAGLLFTSADMHAAAVAAVMPSMQALSTLDLSHTGLTQDMWAQIRTMLPRLHGLHTLNVSNNRLSTVPVDAAKAALAEGADLAGQPRDARPLPLRVIDLTCNDSLESGKSSAASGIVPFIFGQTELTRLELALTHAFSSSSRDVLVEAFGFLRSLRWLGLQKCRIGATEATALAETFPALQALTLLDLYGNSVRDRGMSVLAKRMAALQELRVLNLGMNNVTDEGVEELVAALPRMPHLRRLHLMSNGIGDQGARGLSKALPDVPSLRNLMLFGNRMSAQGQEVLEGRCAKHGVQVLVARCMV